jgi:hypothetical protein
LRIQLLGIGYSHDSKTAKSRSTMGCVPYVQAPADKNDDSTNVKLALNIEEPWREAAAMKRSARVNSRSLRAMVVY